MADLQKSQLGKWLVIVPARRHSTRLPEKPLQDLAGKPLVVRVVENLRPLQDDGAEVVVATDSDKIVTICEEHQITAQLTSPDHPSGTDRCWELAQKSDRSLILNVQGDEPFVPVTDLTNLMKIFERDKKWDLGTLAHKSTEPSHRKNPAVVKVVRAGDRALYFSRAAVPWDRDNPDGGALWQHIGVYAFRRSSLEQFCQLAPSPLETTEKLEQLRALEAGMPVLVCDGSKAPKGIDTPEDLEAARAHFK